MSSLGTITAGVDDGILTLTMSPCAFATLSHDSEHFVA